MPAQRLLALTRRVSPAFERCELTHLARSPIDLGRARRQHREYEALLESLGCIVERLPEDEELPDSVFVEDTTVVVDELAVITRPGAESRRREVETMAAALAPYRKVARIEEPGTLDGGDVLRIGRRLFVGRSPRSNDSGREQLAALLHPFGYEVEGVDMHDCLHLKTAVTAVAPATVLINEAWVDTAPFAAYERIAVDPLEPFAGNALRVAGCVVMPAAFPATRARLEARGIAVRTVDVSEMAKAEGGVTCCSVLVDLDPELDPAS